MEASTKIADTANGHHNPNHAGEVGMERETTDFGEPWRVPTEI